MTDFDKEIQTIYSGFFTGRITKAEAITRFTQLLKENNLMPPAEEIPPTVSATELLTSLKRAYLLKERNPCAETPSPLFSPEEGGGVREKRPRGMNCPVCGKHADTIYNSITKHGGEKVPITPRCEACAFKWIEDNVTNAYVPDTTMRDMETDEAKFFASYEGQMKGFKV